MSFRIGRGLGWSLLRRPSVIHSCCIASSGVIRFVGSHLQERNGTGWKSLFMCVVVVTNMKSFHYFTYTRQCRMKSRNIGSLVFSTLARSFELGRRFFPLLLVMFLGFPLESDWSIIKVRCQSKWNLRCINKMHLKLDVILVTLYN